MLVKELFLEAPQSALPTEFGLDDPETNKNTILKLSKKKTEVLLDDDEYLFFRTGITDGSFVLIEKRTDLIVYMSKYVELNKKLTGKTVTQVLVWRDNTNRDSKKLPGYMMIDILLDKWPTIMSDSLQTDEGFEFWGRRMKEANERGLKVGYADFNEKMIEWYVGPESFDEWLEDVDLYGAAEKYQAIRMLISKN